MVINKKYILTEKEFNILNYDNDLDQNFYKIIFKIMVKNLINKYPKINIYKIVLISNKDAEILYPLLKYIKIDNSKWSKRNY